MKGLTYDDVLLLPYYSDIESRSNVDLSTRILPNLRIEYPFISANMDTITESAMIIAMRMNECLGILHRFVDDFDAQLYNIRTKLSDDFIRNQLVVSIGFKDEERLEQIYKAGIRFIAIDVAHGHHIGMKRILDEIKAKYHGHFEIIAGNVCTYEGVRDLYKWGADCVKIGIGPGAVCSTRIKTGCGCPQLSAIIAANLARHDFEKPKNCVGTKFIIADGGLKQYGDVTKALAAGADAVMLGGMFAGCKETPAKRWRDDRQKLKVEFRGMASEDAQNDQGVDDPYEEGISLGVDYKGRAKHVIRAMTKGVKSGFSYCGARNIKDLQANHKFIIMTNNGFAEGTPHHD